MKLIRECRMGLPKSFKTGSVVGSYPKPLLYLGFDRGGIDVVPSKNAEHGSFPWNAFHEDIEQVKPTQLTTKLSGPVTPITAVDYTLTTTAPLDASMRAGGYQQPYKNFAEDYSAVAAHINSGKPLPWKTVVLDSVTGYEDLILSCIASVNPKAMEDARAWAGMTGAQVRRTILTLTTWPCHVVVIMHAALDKNELTGQITELPSVFSSSLRADIGGLFSQFFYQAKLNGVPKIWTTDKMFVRGIGARWPVLPGEVDPDFNSIYGKELK